MYGAILTHSNIEISLVSKSRAYLQNCDFFVFAGRRKSSRLDFRTKDFSEDNQECCICHGFENEDEEELLQCSKCSTVGNYVN